MRKITPDEYETITARVKPSGDEEYAAVIHKVRGKTYVSVHVFERRPSTKEISDFENMASKLRFRGSRAEVEGSQILAATKLYDRLIGRVYDLPSGFKVLGETTPLPREKAVELVPALVKRAAIRDFIGEVYAASAAEEDDEDTPVSKEDD